MAMQPLDNGHGKTSKHTVPCYLCDTTTTAVPRCVSVYARGRTCAGGSGRAASNAIRDGKTVVSAVCSMYTVVCSVDMVVGAWVTMGGSYGTSRRVQ
jgi:hypothetical protein